MALVNQCTAPVSKSQTCSCGKKAKLQLQIWLHLCSQISVLDADAKEKISAERDGTFHFPGSALSYSYLPTADMNDGGESWQSPRCPLSQVYTNRNTNKNWKYRGICINKNKNQDSWHEWQGGHVAIKWSFLFLATICKICYTTATVLNNCTGTPALHNMLYFFREVLKNQSHD